MTKKLQDLAWAALPKEFKEEVKSLYNRNVAENDISAYATIETLFGPHNLTSDAEGEDDETLYVSRKKLQYFYENLRRVGENHAAFALQSLFGSKCLPDENSSNVEKLEKNDEDYNVDSSEQKAAGSKYGSDDKVTLNGYGGFVITSSYLDPYTREYKYRLGGFKGHFCESDLEAYTEPKENPILSNLTELNSKEADRQFDNILKDGFSKERRLNIAVRLTCAMIPKYQDNGDGHGLSVLNEKDMIKCAYRLADILIAEAEKGGDNENI